MNTITVDQIEELLTHAHGPVSYQSEYARTTALVMDGRCTRKQFASDYLNELLESERKAQPKPTAPTVTPRPRSEPYHGPFPRGRHSHRCIGCEKRNNQGAVACYKARCTKPQLTATCEWCRDHYRQI